MFSCLTELTGNIYDINNFVEKRTKLIAWHLNYSISMIIPIMMIAIRSKIQFAIKMSFSKMTDNSQHTLKIDLNVTKIPEDTRLEVLIFLIRILSCFALTIKIIKLVFKHCSFAIMKIAFGILEWTF